MDGRNQFLSQTINSIEVAAEIPGAGAIRLPRLDPNGISGNRDEIADKNDTGNMTHTR